MKMRVRVRARLCARRPAGLSMSASLYTEADRPSLAYVRARALKNIYIAKYF